MNASQRRRNNLIKGLMNGRGDWYTDVSGMVDISKYYFGNLF